MPERFTLDHLSNRRHVPDATECCWDVDVDGIRPGRALAEPTMIGAVVGIQRIERWVVQELNQLVTDHGEDAVVTALISQDGLRVRNPVSEREMLRR